MVTKQQMLDSVLKKSSDIDVGKHHWNLLSTDPLRAFDNIFFVLRNDSIFFPSDDLSSNWSARSTWLNCERYESLCRPLKDKGTHQGQ